MPDSVRLAKRVAALARCSRSEAAQYIEGGWVTVDGHVVERPHCMVGDETVAIDPAARLEAVGPATLLLHAPIGFDPDAGIDAILALARPDTRWAEDPSDVRMLQRHFHRLMPLVPLDLDASGLIVLTQDGRVRRRLTEDLAGLEQEFVVEVSGELAPYGLARLNHGLQYAGRSLPPCKVSWQSEARLRFAIKDVRRGQLRAMCAQVGLEATAIRRIRIGRIPLAKMPPRRWRYLPVGTRF